MVFSEIINAFHKNSDNVDNDSIKNNVVLLPYSTNVEQNEFYYLALIDEEGNKKEKKNDHNDLQKEDTNQLLLNNHISKLYILFISLFGIYVVYKMFKKSKI